MRICPLFISMYFVVVVGYKSFSLSSVFHSHLSLFLFPSFVFFLVHVHQIKFYNNIKDLNSIGCYSNEGGKWRRSKTLFLSDDTLEISINEKFIGERGRINCSLRDSSGFWRWLGIQFVISDKN